MLKLGVNIGGIAMNNPVTVASGTFGWGTEYQDFFDPAQLGALVMKGTTLHPRAGNPGVRIVETPSGMLNSIGLENPGVHAFKRDILPNIVNLGVPIIVNIAGDTAEEYAEVAWELSQAKGVAGIEVNVSCPNVKKGGMAFGTDPQALKEVVASVRNHTSLPVIVKLSPNVTDIVTMAKIAVEAGADALSIINTLLGMSIDIYRRKPVLGNIMGGLSGPAIKPVAVRMVWQISSAVDVPIIGMGGITTSQDALEFILAGATAVAVGTGNFVNPSATMDVLIGIREYMSCHKVTDINELIGAAKRD
jgi:dihydroorotate dehydrogenase (NAD+) catalytic subunit